MGTLAAVSPAVAACACLTRHNISKDSSCFLFAMSSVSNAIQLYILSSTHSLYCTKAPGNSQLAQHNSPAEAFKAPP